MAKKTKPGRRKKVVRKKQLPTRYVGFDNIPTDTGDILADLEELAVVVESIFEARVSEIEDIDIDAATMIALLKDSVEELDED